MAELRTRVLEGFAKFDERVRLVSAAPPPHDPELADGPYVFGKHLTSPDNKQCVCLHAIS